MSLKTDSPLSFSTSSIFGGPLVFAVDGARDEVERRCRFVGDVEADLPRKCDEPIDLDLGGDAEGVIKGVLLAADMTGRCRPEKRVREQLRSTRQAESPT